MENSLIEQYKQEMMKIYGMRARAVNTAEAEVVANNIETPPENSVGNDSVGKLMGVITAVRSLYFVPNARVTVFKGDTDNIQVIDSDVTDENGRTKPFVLSTPNMSLSLNSQNTEAPYELYNMKVEADGYLTNIHLNIPIFPTITSLQPSNLLLLETAGVDKGPRIFDEKQNYNL